MIDIGSLESRSQSRILVQRRYRFYHHCTSQRTQRSLSLCGWRVFATVNFVVSDCEKRILPSGWKDIQDIACRAHFETSPVMFYFPTPRHCPGWSEANNKGGALGLENPPDIVAPLAVAFPAAVFSKGENP